jgi:hypothetical protein
VIDILVQRYRDARAARRFFRKLLKGQGSKPRRLVTDKLKSYAAADRSVMSSVAHDTRRYANNRAEVSHQPTRQRERQMRWFKTAGQAQRFLSVHGVVQNFFRLGRHHLRSPHYRLTVRSVVICLLQCHNLPRSIDSFVDATLSLVGQAATRSKASSRAFRTLLFVRAIKLRTAQDVALSRVDRTTVVCSILGCPSAATVSRP